MKPNRQKHKEHHYRIAKNQLKQALKSRKVRKTLHTQEQNKNDREYHEKNQEK